MSSRSNNSHTEEPESTGRPRESVGELFRTVIYALLIAVLFRTLLFQPFSIPSGSMRSTLLVGDYLFVSKYAYGYSKYSLPFGASIPDSVFGGRILGGEPERGDVIVFRNPKDDHTDYIKRVIGLPGDRVQLRRGVLHLNGEPVELERVADFSQPRPGLRDPDCVRGLSSATRCVSERFVETLPNGVRHEVLNADNNRSPTDNTCDFVVPAGHYFFLGDNRDNSTDSRFGHTRLSIPENCGDPGRRKAQEGGPGMVPAQHLVGRAELLLLSSDGAFWELWNWRGDRFFKWIN